MTTYTQIMAVPTLANPDNWTVEAIDADGSIEQAIFAGPNAEGRARRYCSAEYGGEK